MAIKIKNSNGEWVVDQKAIETSIIDLNSNFKSTNVEGALRELVEQINTLKANNIALEKRLAYLEQNISPGGSGEDVITEVQLTFEDGTIMTIEN